MHIKIIALLLILSSLSFGRRQNEPTYKHSVLVHPYNLMSPVLFENGYWFEIDYILRIKRGVELISTLTIRKDEQVRGFSAWLDDTDANKLKLYTLGIGARKTFTHWKVKPYVTGSVTSGYYHHYRIWEYNSDKVHIDKDVYIGGHVGGGWEFFLNRFNAHIEYGIAISNTVDTDDVMAPNIAVGISF